MPTIGVLALQGDFALHAELLTGLGVDVLRVRRPAELEQADAIILPGGESTTLTLLLERSGLREPLEHFVREKPVFGTCAGCILLAHELEDAGGAVPLGRLDITVQRNGFGRQVDSFEEAIVARDESITRAGAGTFIRAPRIRRVGEGVDVWATWRDEPVGVVEGSAAALTFHPEVLGEASWHRRWLERAGLLPAAHRREGPG